jgi:hypothetical protein
MDWTMTATFGQSAAIVTASITTTDLRWRSHAHRKGENPMPCEWLKSDDGTIIHINRGRGKKKTCPFCKRGTVSKLCDFPVGNGKTCDAEMCDQCATRKGFQDTPLAPGLKRINDTVDVCPIHKNQEMP